MPAENCTALVSNKPLADYHTSEQSSEHTSHTSEQQTQLITGHSNLVSLGSAETDVTVTKRTNDATNSFD